MRRGPEAAWSIPYERLRPLVLSRNVVRLPDVNRIAPALRDLFPDWEKGKRFHAGGRRFNQNSSGQSKNPVDSDHGIYREPSL
jgi:hypothetical protein